MTEKLCILNIRRRGLWIALKNSREDSLSEGFSFWLYGISGTLEYLFKMFLVERMENRESKNT